MRQPKEGTLLKPQSKLSFRDVLFGRDTFRTRRRKRIPLQLDRKHIRTSNVDVFLLRAAKRALT